MSSTLRGAANQTNERTSALAQGLGSQRPMWRVSWKARALGSCVSQIYFGAAQMVGNIKGILEVFQIYKNLKYK